GVAVAQVPDALGRVERADRGRRVEYRHRGRLGAGATHAIDDGGRDRGDPAALGLADERGGAGVGEGHETIGALRQGLGSGDAVPPIDLQGERLESVRVGEGPGQGGRCALEDYRRRYAQPGDDGGRVDARQHDVRAGRTTVVGDLEAGAREGAGGGEGRPFE